MIHSRQAMFAAAMLTMGMMTTSAGAAQIHVRPVLIELAAPAAAATLTLNNRGKGLVTAQVRVFRWTQIHGRDRLTPTRDVVASPPLLRMVPGRDNVVRVVRIAKRPVQGEESYRLVIDQIPDRSKKRTGVIFAVRYMIPVFFHARGAKDAQLSWKAVRRGRKIILTAHNEGVRHERVSNLRISFAGKTQVISNGLAGYVLGRSSKTWGKRLRLRASGTITIKGQGIHGPIKAKARLR